jgi:PAS domain S-box-containing protein
MLQKMHTPNIFTTAHQRLSRGSILWRAVLHSVLLSTVSIVLLSAISYLFMYILIQRGSIDVEVYELVEFVAQLGRTLILVGVISFVLSIVLSFSFGRNLTKPFLEMRQKVERIRPGHWSYKHTIHTGDEVEQLDEAFAKLTRRLTQIYTHQEEEIAARTHELEIEYEKDRTILRSIQAGILVVDREGIVQQANPAALLLLKAAEADVLGKASLQVLPLLKKKDLLMKSEHPVYQCLRRSEQVQATSDTHLNITLKNNTGLPVKLAVSPLMQGKKITGAIVLFQDVTAERQVDYMKTDFLTLASHHLRTPLSTLQWYLELFTTEEKIKFSEQQQSFLTEMRLAAKKMSLVLGELMDASRLSEGGVVPVFQNVDVCTLVADIVRDSKSLFESQDVHYKLEFNEKECVMVHTDPLLASIILQNFMQNAAKYSKKGTEVTLHLSKEKENVRIEVRDQGIGVPYTEQAHIFQKLYRASNARSFEANGAGLGLYSCKMIAEKLGAKIGFTSEEGTGSTFQVSFPTAKAVAKKPKSKHGKRGSRKA